MPRTAVPSSSSSLDNLCKTADFYATSRFIVKKLSLINSKPTPFHRAYSMPIASYINLDYL